MSKLMSLLFETHAFKVAPENNPFWYTSGKIGPYFINADYLYGSEADSKELLSFIDDELYDQNRNEIPFHIFREVLNHYNSNETYRYVINSMKDYIEEHIDINKIDYISGGERRDWFYSNMMAYLLDKPHITIYKNLSTVESDSKFIENKPLKSLEGKNVLHVADLLNQSASFTRAWIPAIKNLGSNICWSVFAVDRVQGGTETLEKAGVEVHSLLKIDDSLFDKALELKEINEEQLEMLKKFKSDPDGSMRKFLIEHPEFIEEAKKSDNKKTQARVKLLLEQDIYGIYNSDENN